MWWPRYYLTDKIGHYRWWDQMQKSANNIIETITKDTITLLNSLDKLKKFLLNWNNLFASKGIFFLLFPISLIDFYNVLLRNRTFSKYWYKKHLHQINSGRFCVGIWYTTHPVFLVYLYWEYTTINFIIWYLYEMDESLKLDPMYCNFRPSSVKKLL